MKTKKSEETSPSKAGTSGEKTSPSKATVKPGADANTVEYNPAKNKYHVIDDASWQHGKPVPYLALAKTLECIEDTSARLRIAEILSNFLRSVIVLTPDNLLQCVYLCLNKLAPAFEGLELGLAERSLMKAVAQSSGRSEKQVQEDTEETGDVGIVAQNSCGRQAKLFRPPPLTVPAVFNQLKAVASMKGRDSMMRKLDKVVAMYNACKPIEARYLIRSLAGKLRIGLAEQTVLQAIALACTTTPPGQDYPPPILNAAQGISTEAFKAKLDEQALILKTTYCECPVYDKIIPMLLEHGIKELPKNCKISPGIPLRPMLAHPTKGVNEVHISGRGATVRIFSRNQEDNTSKFPEVVTRLADQLAEDVTECILDCEAVGWDRETNRILPFQILSTRKKKVDPEKGISLRFPRFLRIRDDKKVEEATSASQVAELYQNQDQVKNQAESKVATEDDFY
ncbi:hypothetical protein B566_EDAN015775 [Ephemera danica]|nr:hypothetical protein B566_EDAN015775 [Ephemera danica]